MKATRSTTFRSLQSELNRINNQVETLRLQTASGKRVSSASDDPAAVRPILNARARIEMSDGYLRTMDVAETRLSVQDSYLDQAENLLISAREIAVAAGNGSLSDADLASYGERMGDILDSMYGIANAQSNGKYLFAGFADQTQPFPDTSDPTGYAGDDGAVELEIGPGETVTVNLSGTELFQGEGGGINIFALLSDLRDSLAAGEPSQVTDRLDDLESASNQIVRQRNRMGNTAQRVEEAQTRMEDVRIDMQEMLSRYEDADAIETIAALTQQETALQAALKITGTVAQLSILDYL
jgi:flagellar hook-associated protein 3 FlgL